ncbi:lipoyl(octanoyl) transferase LipB [Kitasatospora sp. NBC_00240]|uniref:lipoyl(octanoyl) transferase LipB n=1 Tax=Kitasatospora sp. NBC_00240 TaxID=2903567 RepID=UPI0022564620|nr:lipoyl(octanoyl) transferase LipB [Kitasatospora sp. NBC_00240]MCX5213342.1 lipoyl(octanoyl) transferase LipB [Kitasatospora sp. NBC_00240]
MSENVRFVRMGIGDRSVPYQEAWEEQQRLHALRVADEIPDTVLLLEHPPVYTAGRRTNPEDRPLDGTPVVEVNRGGEITWHGPGQLIGYPIVKLPEPMDVVAYVRRLEEALIRACGEFGVETTRIEGRSGVWVLGESLPGAVVDPAQVVDIGSLTLRMGLPLGIDPRLAGPEYAASNAGQRGDDRKLAAIGVRVARGVTMHGFALNCNPDMSWFDRIVPCGIRDAGVGSVSTELGRVFPVGEALPAVEKHLAEVFAELAEPALAR